MTWFELLGNWLAESEVALLLTSLLTAIIIMFNYWSGTTLVRSILLHKQASRSTKASQQLTAGDYWSYCPTQNGNFVQTHLGDGYLAHNSPININSERCVVRNLCEQLTWHGYHQRPLTIVLHNNGETVVVRAGYACNTPRLSGANMRTHYNFIEIVFKWGWQQNDGSEHMLNFSKYPLELQALHCSGPFMRDCMVNYDLLAVAYFFNLGADNSHLDPIVKNLHLIQQPNTFIEIPPFRLESLLFPFGSDFFSYEGTFVDQPNTIYSRWFIYPHVFSMGPHQLQEFRKLFRHDGTPMIKNSRILKPLGNREVVFNVWDDEEEDIF